MTWTCGNCAKTNRLTVAVCPACGEKRSRGASWLAYLTAGPSVLLLIVLLLLGGYARALHLGRSAARADVAAGLQREETLKRDAASAREQAALLQNALGETRQKLDQANAQLAEANLARESLSQQVGELQSTVETQAERLSRRSNATVKAVVVDSRCLANVRLAIRYRDHDGSWPTASFWTIGPLERGRRLQLKTSNGLVPLRVTWNRVYVYAAAEDGRWWYGGVNGEQETVRDGGYTRTMRVWDLPTDINDNYHLTLCS